MKKINILVTGAGGDIGQSIGKILLKSAFTGNLHGLDISDKNAGKFIYPNFSLGLRVDSQNYLMFIKEYISSNQIDLVIPIAEPELREYEKQSWSESTLGAKVLTPNQKSLQIGFDKLETALFLKSIAMPYPITELANHRHFDLNFPLILKSRTGSGSKTLHVTYSEEELKFYMRGLNGNEYILQEYIPAHEGEYTSGLFRSQSGEIRDITFKRELTGGYSGYGELVTSKVISNHLIKLAENLDLSGAINVQLRMRKGVPYIFEINPRFSSTVFFRDLFGFRDVEWSILDLFGQDLPEHLIQRDLSRFYKGFQEYVD